MKPKFLSLLLACWFGAVGLAAAQNLDQEVSGLADNLSKALVAKGYKTVANLDFTDIQGQPTELGRLLSDQLAVEIISAGGVSIVDRANLKSILAEHKLTEEGLVNPANAKKLGEFAGVDALLIGNVASLDDGFVLIVKAIATESATIVAAGRIKFRRTSDLQQLFNRGIFPGLTAPAATTSPGEPGSARFQGADVASTQEVGPLRVTLKAAIPMKWKDNYGRNRLGIKCSFELLNRETQRATLVAANAEPGAHQMGDLIRASVNDNRGGMWVLSTSRVAGMGIVAAGGAGWNETHNSTEIVSLLMERDQRNTDVSRDDERVKFIFGSTTSIPPGQTAQVTMAFTLLTEGYTSPTLASPPPEYFQLNVEMVVGTIATDGRKSYSLQNLTFDRVTMPKF